MITNSRVRCESYKACPITESRTHEEDRFCSWIKRVLSCMKFVKKRWKLGKHSHYLPHKRKNNNTRTRESTKNFWWRVLKCFSVLRLFAEWRSKENYIAKKIFCEAKKTQVPERGIVWMKVQVCCSPLF